MLKANSRNRGCIGELHHPGDALQLCVNLIGLRSHALDLAGDEARLLGRDAVAPSTKKGGQNLSGLECINTALHKFAAEPHQIRWRKLLRIRSVVRTFQITQSASPFELAKLPWGSTANYMKG